MLFKSFLNAFALCLIIAFTATQAYAELPFGLKGVVALDPGHGGRDIGAQGSGGLQEKNICLTLAQKLAHELENNYLVVLTRSEDYHINPVERAAIANSHQADLLVSLHLGAGYRHTATGIAIYHYQPVRTTASGESAKLAATVSKSQLWTHQQLPYMTTSRALAKTIQQAFTQSSEFSGAQIYQAPLKILQGAAMPAVLIEIGHITNPATEKKLGTQTRLTSFARVIAQAIDQYMNSK